MARRLSSESHLARAARGRALGDAERAALARLLLDEPGPRRLFGITPDNAPKCVEERLRTLPAVWNALHAAPLRVAGYEESPADTPRDLFCVHLPLARHLIGIASGRAERTLVAVAGVPAGGKSVFTAVMLRVLRALEPPFGVAALGLDGYHYRNAYLDAHRTPPGVPEPASLRPYKGAHFTFDALRLADDLRTLETATVPVALPAYDRTLHEPIDGAVTIEPRDRLVLVEGNYLLLRQGQWEHVADRFHLRIYLDLPPGLNRERMIARHVRGGRSPDAAARHYERSDRANTDLVAATRPEAHIVVTLDAAYRPRTIAPGPSHSHPKAAAPTS